MKKRIGKKYYRDDKRLAEIGARIRHIRTERGLTQMELAFKCNDIDYSQINRIELGKVNFNISYLLLIAEILDVDAQELLKRY